MQYLKNNQLRSLFFTFSIFTLLQFHASAQIKTFQSKEPEVYQSKTIEIYNGKPSESEHDKRNNQTTENPLSTAHEIEVYKPGVDVVENSKTPDPRLKGKWKLSIPSTSWQTETDKGSYTERTLKTGLGAGTGTLSINAGRYVWKTNSGMKSGKLVQVRPKSDLQKGVDAYWRISDGKNNYFIFWDPKINSMSVYNETTHLFAMLAERI